METSFMMKTIRFKWKSSLPQEKNWPTWFQLTKMVNIASLTHQIVSDNMTWWWRLTVSRCQEVHGAFMLAFKIVFGKANFFRLRSSLEFLSAILDGWKVCSVWRFLYFEFGATESNSSFETTPVLLPCNCRVKFIWARQGSRKTSFETGHRQGHPTRI